MHNWGSSWGKSWTTGSGHRMRRLRGLQRSYRFLHEDAQRLRWLDVHSVAFKIHYHPLSKWQLWGRLFGR